MSWLFELKGSLNKRQALVLAIGGFLFFLLIWFLLTMGESPLVPRALLPHPSRVVTAFGDLHRDNNLIKNIFLSLALNFGGYIKAIGFAIPVGFAIGLVPLFRGANQRLVDAIRFLPLTALTMLFIVWFGIGSQMKVNFLAFGIFIYLLPTVIQRIDEVDDVYVKTVYTLGASPWQIVKSVYFPAVVSKLSDDIRVLTAISWTYIIVVENIASAGGLGNLIYSVAQRQARVDKVFAILIIIMLIGVFQDRLFLYLDRKFFPHKYQAKESYQAQKHKEVSNLWATVSDFGVSAFGYIFLGMYVLLSLDEMFGILGNIRILAYFFEDRQWVVHTIGLIILVYQAFKLFNIFQERKAKAKLSTI